MSSVKWKQSQEHQNKKRFWCISSLALLLLSVLFQDTWHVPSILSHWLTFKKGRWKSLPIDMLRIQERKPLEADPANMHKSSSVRTMVFFFLKESFTCSHILPMTQHCYFHRVHSEAVDEDIHTPPLWSKMHLNATLHKHIDTQQRPRRPGFSTLTCLTFGAI